MNEYNPTPTTSHNLNRTASNEVVRESIIDGMVNLLKANNDKVCSVLDRAVYLKNRLVGDRKQPKENEPAPPISAEGPEFSGSCLELHETIRESQNLISQLKDVVYELEQL